jgi:predicted nucleic acid-binding protein
MSVLVDTNILLRRTQPGHEHHAAAVESVARLLGAGQPVYFTLQNISEFWNVMTRPIAANGLGFSPALALREVDNIERILTLLPDTAAVYPEWKRLVTIYGVSGAKVHDARRHYERPRSAPNPDVQHGRLLPLRNRGIASGRDCLLIRFDKVRFRCR